VAGDGVVSRGEGSADLRAAVDSLVPESRRLDLGEAIKQAADILAGEGLPGGIVILSDLQASALSPVRVSIPITAARPMEAPPANSGVGAIDVGPQPWAAGTGTVVARLTGERSATVPITVAVGERVTRNALASGGTGTASIAGLLPGWWIVSVSQSPDEFRGDDERVAVLRVVPPARANCTGLDRHLQAACQVLTESGRLLPGDGVALSGLGRGSSVVAPPADPAQLGALNRALERRGSSWRFGPLVAQPASRTAAAGGAGTRHAAPRTGRQPTRRGGRSDRDGRQQAIGRP
jgi:hypothetical protein